MVHTGIDMMVVIYPTIAQAGSDYVPISMDLMFIRRETLILVNITIIDDDKEEQPERFELVMEPVSNLFSAKPIGTITILDDESRELYLIGLQMYILQFH